MGRRLVGRISLILLFSLTFSCVIVPQEKPLNPKLLFTIGSSFLNNVSSLALKGQIEFSDGRSSQSGGFEMFLAGRDSLSFVIEGPLGADIFRMIVIDSFAFMLSSKDEGWVTLGRMELASVAEYGIDNISPFQTGLMVIPQLFVDSLTEKSQGQFSFDYDLEKYECATIADQKRFSIMEPSNQIVAEYGRRHEIGGGYYPSHIKISRPGESWQISLRLERVRINPQIPPRAWRRD